MDLLVPRIGELLGGSAREDRADVLRHAMVEALGVARRCVCVILICRSRPSYGMRCCVILNAR